MSAPAVKGRNAPPGDNLLEQAVWLVVMRRFCSRAMLCCDLGVHSSTADDLLTDLRRLGVVDPKPGLEAPNLLVASAELPALLERLRAGASS